MEKKIIDMIKNKDTHTSFKELSKLTNYHEKSLIRINKKIRDIGYENYLNNLKLKRGNSSKIDDDEIKYIKNIIINTKGPFTKKYNEYLKIALKGKEYTYRSLSTIYKICIQNNLIVHKQKPRKNTKQRNIIDINNMKDIVIFKVSKIKFKNIIFFAYILIDYRENKILHIEFSKNRDIIKCCKILQQLINMYNIPDNIYTNGSLLLRKSIYGQTSFSIICNDLGINILEYRINEFEKIYIKNKKIITDNLYTYIKQNNLNTIEKLGDFVSKKFVLNSKDFSYKTKGNLNNIFTIRYVRSIMSDGTIELNNKKLNILSNNTKLLRYSKVNVITDLDGNNITVQYNNEMYKTSLKRIKISKKPYY
ncbi:MAG: hypothetical protein PHD15_04695 [Clostridia bacterium]|nr:hypothetical protein [Clostridia bacterium]MDD4387038.1 hypothetical protein [Clostridia bacterium]